MTLSTITKSNFGDLLRAFDAFVVVMTLYGVMILSGVALDRSYLILFLIIILSVITIFKSTQIYDGNLKIPLTNKVHRLLTSWMLLLAWLLCLGFVTKSTDEFSRFVITSWSIIAPCALIFTHLILGNKIIEIRNRFSAQRQAIIVGSCSTAQNLAQYLTQASDFKVTIQGFFEIYPVPADLLSLDGPLLGSIDDVADYVSQQSIDLVYITSTVQGDEVLINLCTSLQDTTACVYYVPNMLIFSLSQAKVHDMYGVPILPLWQVPYSETEYMLKRISDVALSSLILILISPVMLLIIAAIKLTSQGPVIFKQRRYGLNGQEIIIYKFRSMYMTQEENDVKQAKRGDPRITKVGIFLRRTSLDELPQFINVLQGRMSIVGPRPHAVSHNEMYRKQISGYMLRHKVKPGITGLAQVNGYRGETDSLDQMKGRIKYDLEYLHNWSFSLDFSIFFRTVFTFLIDSNAY